VAAAGAPARALPAPARREPERRPVRAPQRRPDRGPARASRLSRQSLTARLVVFVVLLALLGVGRVTLSFAVVQKNLQTDALARQQRVVDAANQRLQERAATLSSALTVRQVAMDKYHLIISPDVQFITVHRHHAVTSAGH
jgi:uncharacterized protein HemX